MNRYLILFLCLLPIHHALAQCNGAYKGRALTRHALVALLKAQKKPLNLCGVILRDVDLSNISLHQANLSTAIMDKSRLEGSDFSETNLSGSHCINCDIKNAYFSQAKLNNSDFSYAHGEQPIFRDAHLDDASFNNTNMPKADFTQAQATGARFERAKMNHAIFRFARLDNSDFTLVHCKNCDFSQSHSHHSLMILLRADNAIFKQSEMTHTNFLESILVGSDFTDADVSHSRFNRADLSRSFFIDTTINAADFSGARLQDLHYAPKAGSLPNIVSLSRAMGLPSLEFSVGKQMTPALNELRLAYQKAGMRDMERLITTIVKRKQMQQQWDSGGFGLLLATMNFLLFDVTCDFGQSPQKPFMLFLLLIVFFALPYRFALARPRKRFCLVVMWQESRSRLSNISLNGQPYHSRVLTAKVTTHWLMTVAEQCRLTAIALYFSLLCAFHIGWDDFNIAKWIREMQSKTYIIQAQGRLRLISGLQSIISAYLAVLWVLTYFGSPFNW